MSKKLFRSHTVMCPGCGRRRGRLWVGDYYDRTKYGCHFSPVSPQCPKVGEVIPVKVVKAIMEGK